jgi:hypothetical protein
MNGEEKIKIFFASIILPGGSKFSAAAAEKREERNIRVYWSAVCRTFGKLNPLGKKFPRGEKICPLT